VSARARSLALVATCIGFALPQDPKPADDARLQIEVVDADGRPVTGASVFTLPSDQLSSRYHEVLESEDRRPQWFEVVERFGARCATDERGEAVLDHPADGLELVAKAEGLYASLTTEGSEKELRVALERDLKLVLVAIDANGRPAPGVEMVIVSRPGNPFADCVEDPMFLPLGCAWIGKTNALGEAVVEHVQCIVRPENSQMTYAALGIPVKHRERVDLHGDALPAQPIVFHMPQTGTVVTEGPQPSTALGIRRARDPAEGGLGQCWSSNTPCQMHPRDGKAEFPYVELGLQIEARAWWKGLGAPLSTTAPGPTELDRTATIRLEMPTWMANDEAETRIVATQGERGGAVLLDRVDAAARSDSPSFALLAP
jgi:hypothetical protein